jgi:fructokinase
MIVVGGECLIDMVEREGEGGQSFLALPGGSPFNVALAAGRLGLPVSFLSRQSTDEFGRRLTAALVASEVDLSLCPTTDQPSTLAIAGLDPERKGARYLFYTEGTAGVSLSEDELPATLPAEVRALHVGSFSLTMEPIASALEALVKREAGERVISIDPNIRPMLMQDPELARERLRALLPRADILKLSDEDLDWLEPGKDEEEFAFEMVMQGVALVLLTRGGEGASARGARGACDIPGGEIELVDSIGAGDTFMAATLAWLAEKDALSKGALKELTGEQMEDLLSFATAAAGVTCRRAGCDPPWRAELGD